MIGDVNLSGMNQKRYVPVPGSFYGYYACTDYYPKDNPTKWGLNEMTLTTGSTGEMTISYEDTNKFTYVERTYALSGERISDERKQDLSTDVTLAVSATLKTSILNEGDNQSVKMELAKGGGDGQGNGDKRVTIAARIPGGCPCGSDDLKAR